MDDNSPLEELGLAKRDDDGTILIPSDTELAKHFYALGVRATNQGDLCSAIINFEVALSACPGSQAVMYNLAVVLHLAGNHQEAKRLFEQIISLRPRDVDALNNLGIIYCEEGELEKGKAVLEKVIAISPNFAHAYCNLALCYKRLGDHEKAADLQHRALQLDSKVLKGSYRKPHLPE